LVFIPIIIFGTILTFSSSSWISAWLGLEINLIGIAPLLINKITYQSTEASIKYFLTQAVASVFIIFIVIFINRITLSSSLSIPTLVTAALLLKAGVAPLHFWYPQVIICSEWLQCLILLTWQKIGPFILLSFLNSFILLLAVAFSCFVGALGAINQLNFKNILVYSSIAHSAWIIILIYSNEAIWWVYLLIYSFLNITLIFLFIILNSNSMKEVFSNNISFIFKFIFLVNSLSIAGFPPFLGFFTKLITISSLIKTFTFSLVVVLPLLIRSSFIRFYFYFRVLYTALFVLNVTSPVIIILQIHTNKFSPFIALALISIIGNLIAPIIIWVW